MLTYAHLSPLCPVRVAGAQLSLCSDCLGHDCVFVACFFKDEMLFLMSTLCVHMGLGPAVYSAGLMSIQATLYLLHNMHSNFVVAPTPCLAICYC